MAPLALKSEENNSADRRSSTAVGRFRLFLDIIEPTPRPPPWQWKRASRKYLFKSNRRFLVHSFRHGGLGKCFWLAFLPLFSFSFLFSLGKYFGLFSFLSPPPHFYTTHIFSPRLFIGNVKDALRTLISSETFHFREPQDFFRFFIVSLFFVVVILAWAWFVYCRFVPFFPDLFRTVFLFFLLVAGCRRYPWTAQRREIFFFSSSLPLFLLSSHNSRECVTTAQNCSGSVTRNGVYVSIPPSHFFFFPAAQELLYNMDSFSASIWPIRFSLFRILSPRPCIN